MLTEEGILAFAPKKIKDGQAVRCIYFECSNYIDDNMKLTTFGSTACVLVKGVNDKDIYVINSKKGDTPLKELLKNGEEVSKSENINWGRYAYAGSIPNGKEEGVISTAHYIDVPYDTWRDVVFKKKNELWIKRFSSTTATISNRIKYFCSKNLL